MRTSGMIVGLLLIVALPAGAADGDDDVLFSRDVAPVLVQKCQGCHGPRKHKGGYRLDTFERLMRPGDSEAAPVTPGKPETSELYRLVTSPDKDHRMPKDDDPLGPRQTAVLSRWIALGAPFDGPDRSVAIQSLIKVTHPSAPATYPRPLPAVALAFDPNGGSIAVGGYHEVTRWDVAGRRLLQRIGRVARRTEALAYSPDGSILAVAGGTPGSLGEVRLIPLADPDAARLLDRIGDEILALSFSPDGKKLAAGGTDGSLRVFDVASGRRTLLVEPHADWVTAVAFSPDGSKIASASRDKSARVCDGSTGETLSVYLGQEEALFALAWAPDGKTIYSGGRDREVHAWEPAVEARKVLELKGFTGDVLRLGVVGDHVYSTCSDGKLRQHSRAGGEVVKAVDVASDYVPGLAVDAVHSFVAAGTFDGTVRVFKVPALDGLPGFVASPGH